MHYQAKQAIALGCAFGGGILGILLAPMVVKALPAWDEASAGVRVLSFAIMILGHYAIGLVGVVSGAVLGIFAALVIPGARTMCPNCRSTKARAGERSLFSGRNRSNRCSTCGLTW